MIKTKILPRLWLPITTEVKIDAYDIRGYDPIDLANELTLINQAFLLRIKSNELIDYAFLTLDKKYAAPNITLMFEFYDRVSALMATQILRHKTDQSRASVIIHLFSIIQQLYLKNHDIHSIRSILCALDHPSIFRLRKTWRIFRKEKPKFNIALKYLWNILSQERDWDDYRTWLDEKFIRDCLEKDQPMLLFVGYLLSKMIIDRDRSFQTSLDQQKKISLTQTISARVLSTLIQFVQSKLQHKKS